MSQDAIVLTPPGTIPASSSNNSVATISRLPDEAGRAVFRIDPGLEGTATLEVGSGEGKLVISALVTPAVAGPLVFELDGGFEPA